MGQADAPFRHPLLRAVDEARAALAEVAGGQATFLTTGEKAEALVAAAELITRAEALQLRVLASADDVAQEHGARSAGVWLVHTTRQDGPVGRRAQRLAEGLDQRWPVAAEAYAAGSVSTEQARVIGKALDDLPRDLDPDLRVKAEQHLVEQAALFAPRELRVLGRRVLDVLAPEVAEAHEAKLLEREAQAAWEKAAITRRRLGNGLSQATVRLPDSVMDRWLTQLHAFTSPRRHGHVPADERVSYPRQLAYACQALLERIPEDRLPEHGRTKRLFTATQSKALAVRDRHRRAEGCEVPSAWCEAHHLRPWSQGGRTDLADGALLCSFHHHKAHDTRYDLRLLPNGDLRYHRRE